MEADFNLWLSGIISALVAFVILVIDRFLIEPRIWHSRYKLRSLEKSLEVYGWLISVLKVCQQKAKRQTQEKFTHLLEKGDILNLEEIFEKKKAYLLSERLRQTWYDLQKEDTYFVMMKIKNGEPQFKLTAADLTKMQEQAETDFDQLQSRYNALAKIKY